MKENYCILSFLMIEMSVHSFRGQRDDSEDALELMGSAALIPLRWMATRATFTFSVIDTAYFRTPTELSGIIGLRHH